MFLTFVKEKATFLTILTTTKWWAFDHHFPPSLVIINAMHYFLVSDAYSYVSHT